MRTPAEIEALLRVMRSQGCTELQEPDLMLKVARDAKSVRPVGETRFPAPVEKRPESYDPDKLLAGLDDEDVDPAEIEPDDDEGADAFLVQATKAAEQRRSGGRR